jgi:hypothetical protein
MLKIMYLPKEERPPSSKNEHLNKKRVNQAWGTVIVALIIIPLWIWGVVVYNTKVQSDGVIGFLLALGVISLIIDFGWWTAVAWDHYLSTAINARILYVRRWSRKLNAYETVFFIEWQFERKKWFMGKLKTHTFKWIEHDYYYDDGHYTTLEDARVSLYRELKEMKPKERVSKVDVIEVVVVADEVEKIFIAE